MSLTCHRGPFWAFNMLISIPPPAVDKRHILLLLGAICNPVERARLPHEKKPERFVLEHHSETALTHPSIQVIVCVTALMCGSSSSSRCFSPPCRQLNLFPAVKIVLFFYFMGCIDFSVSRAEREGAHGESDAMVTSQTEMVNPVPCMPACLSVSFW